MATLFAVLLGIISFAVFKESKSNDQEKAIQPSSLSSDEEKNEITLTLSDEDTNEYVFHFNRTEHDDDGAYYQACGDYDLLYPIWICNVTHDVFGEHPEDLYILKIKS